MNLNVSNSQTLSMNMAVTSRFIGNWFATCSSHATSYTYISYFNSTAKTIGLPVAQITPFFSTWANYCPLQSFELFYDAYSNHEFLIQAVGPCGYASLWETTPHAGIHIYNLSSIPDLFQNGVVVNFQPIYYLEAKVDVLSIDFRHSIVYAIGTKNLVSLDIRNPADPALLSNVTLDVTLHFDFYPPDKLCYNKGFIYAANGKHVNNVPNYAVIKYDMRRQEGLFAEYAAPSETANICQNMKILTSLSSTELNIFDLEKWDYRGTLNLTNNYCVSNFRGMMLVDTYVFVSGNSGACMSVYNISDPTRIEQIGAFNSTNSVFGYFNFFNEFFVTYNNNRLAFFNFSIPGFDLRSWIASQPVYGYPINSLIASPVNVTIDAHRQSEVVFQKLVIDTDADYEHLENLVYTLNNVSPDFALMKCFQRCSQLNVSDTFTQYEIREFRIRIDMTDKATVNSTFRYNISTGYGHGKFIIQTSIFVSVIAPENNIDGPQYSTTSKILYSQSISSVETTEFLSITAFVTNNDSVMIEPNATPLTLFGLTGLSVILILIALSIGVLILIGMVTIVFVKRRRRKEANTTLHPNTNTSLNITNYTYTTSASSAQSTLINTQPKLDWTGWTWK